MRRAQTVTLFGIAFPLLLLQATPLGCLPTEGGGGGGGATFNLPPTVVMTADIRRGVAPLVVTFSSSGSTDDGVIVERQWDFGDGIGTSQEISPTYTFRTTGDFTVTLTLRDDQGAAASDTLDISVTERPVAVIKVDRTFAETAPARFEFDASDSYDPDAAAGDKLLYLWEFGDGSSDVQPTLTHTFARAGVFRVKLTVTDAVGVTGTAEKIVEVGIPRPEIAFRSPPASLSNIVVTPSSPLWVHADYDVEPGVPRTLRAGLDRDLDPCNALVAVYDSLTGAELHRLMDFSDREDRQQGPVYTAVFSSDEDNTRILAGGQDGLVRLYDALTGTVLQRYVGNGNPVTGVDFSPENDEFVAGYSDGSVVLRAVGTDEIIRAFVGHAAQVNAVAFGPDGSQVLSGDNAGVAILWDYATGQELLRFEHGGAAVTSVAFSPTNTQRVLTGADDFTARMWSTVNGALTQEFAPVFEGTTQVAGHTDAVTAVDVSPDGTLVVTGSADRTVKVWNAEFGTEQLTVTGHEGTVRAVTFSNDGTQVLSGSDDGGAVIWNRQTGEQVRAFEPCLSPVLAVDYSPTGDRVLLAVAAANDIVLDTSPSSGNDLNLTLPTALQLNDVPTGTEGLQYTLWVEIDTDRTSPSRTYSTTRVNVIPELTEEVAADTPVVPLRVELREIVAPSVLTRISAVQVSGATHRLYNASLQGWGPTDVGDIVTYDVDGAAVELVVTEIVVDDNSDTIQADRLSGTASIAASGKRARVQRQFEVASVVTPATRRTQVFDLGQLAEGDRIYISLLNTPGYGEVYTQLEVNPLSGPRFLGDDRRDGFSVMMLDAQERMFVWYEVQRVFFTPNSKLIIGHNSQSYYVVLDASGEELTPSVHVRIDRGFATDSQPRSQYVHLDFDGGTDIAVAGSAKFSIPEFEIPGRTPGQMTTIKNTIEARVEAIFADYDFEVSQSPPDNSVEPHLTIYFDVTGQMLNSDIPDINGDGVLTVDDLVFWGVPHYIDARNETLSGRAVIAVADMLEDPDIAALGDAALANAIGNAVAHHIGLLAGLRETEEPLPTDIMTNDYTQVTNAGLSLTTANLAGSGDLDPIGIQDAPQLLAELFGEN